MSVLNGQPASESLASELRIVRDHLKKAKTPEILASEERVSIVSRLTKLLDDKRAKLIAHYYTDSLIQDLAEETNGFVGDSLEMARFGRDSDAEILIVAGVKFMGETAKILSPSKTVLMPTLDATCSLDIACPIDRFSRFCDEHKDRTVVVYANTSAAVKARSDWVVTSSIALEVVEYLSDRGEKIIWAPDKHLGSYVQKNTDADILLWDAACIVHEEFKAQGIRDMKRMYPAAAVLAHPEAPGAVLEIADVVGSTTQIIQATKNLPHDDIIVATDQGIFHKLREIAPHKKFIIAPTAGHDATCRSCASCPWMSMNSLQATYETLVNSNNEIRVEKGLALKAMVPLQRMLDFAANRQLEVKGRA